MKCLACKSENMIKSENTYFAQMDYRYVIIEKVPCLKCTQCGEVFYSASTLEKIDELLERLTEINSKIFVMDYPLAA